MRIMRSSKCKEMAMTFFRNFVFAVAMAWTLPAMLYAQPQPLDTAAPDTARIDPLLTQNVDMTGTDLAVAPFERSWQLFGTRARMAIRGYVRLDYIQDFNGAYDRFQFPVVGIPVEGDGRPDQAGYMNMFARESRIGFDFRSFTENDTPLQVFMEIDFFNTADTPFFAAPRIRHFYGVFGRFLAGRTWGTLTDVYSLATTLDFAGGDALAGSRRPQVRFEQPLNDQYRLAVALEMLEFPDIDNVADQTGQESQLLPLLAARVTRVSNRGRAMLGASVYQLRWDGLGTGPDATAVAWGALFSGRLGLGERDFLVWNTSAGNGWGSNIVTGIGVGSAAMLTPDGTLDLLFSWNAQLGGAHYLSDVVALNLSLAWASGEESPLKPGDRLMEGGTAHANVIWSPFKSVNTGVEYMRGLRRNQDGADGTAARVQAMVKFIF
jgi:DcaP outer membrane protein